MRLALPGILFAVSLTLGAAIAYESVAPLDPVTVETPRLAAHRAPAAAPAEYAPPPAALFADLDARPLFSAARKPLQDTTQTNGAAAATSDFVLAGVIMGGTRAVALLRNKSTAATISAAVGDLVNGWRVARIDATTVTLRANGGEFVLPLDGPANRPPSAPMQVAPPPEPVPASASPSPPAASVVQSVPVTTPAKPALPAHAGNGTISPEALKGAFIDPATGEPTL